jgi:hypothetical protein
MTPGQWARVFDAGASAAFKYSPGTQDVRAVVTDALRAMADEARKISKETR